MDRNRERPVTAQLARRCSDPMKKTKRNVPNNPSLTRRPPMVRSAYCAFLIGAIGGAIMGVVQIYLLKGGLDWTVAGGVVGLLLGLVIGGDLLIPGPPKRHLSSDQGDRVGPFRGGVLLLLLSVEGLLFGAYLWGSVTLTCERLVIEQAQTPQVNCQRTVTGWLNRQQTGKIVYETVIGVGLDIRDELLLQHGPYQQSQSAPGFGTEAMAAVQAFLDAPTPTLTLIADGWMIWLGSSVCLLIALLTGIWAFFSVRHGLHSLREQFALGEVYWGWSRT